MERATLEDMRVSRLGMIEDQNVADWAASNGKCLILPTSQRRRPKEDGIIRIGILKLPANAKTCRCNRIGVTSSLELTSMLNLDQTNIVANMCANYTDKTFQNCVEEWIRRARKVDPPIAHQLL